MDVRDKRKRNGKGNNPGTDVVVVCRAESAPLAPADVPVTNEVYLQGLAQVASVEFGAGTVPVGTTKNATGATSTLFRKDGLTPAEIRKYVVSIYFIAPCSPPADGSTSSGPATTAAIRSRR